MPRAWPLWALWELSRPSRRVELIGAEPLRAGAIAFIPVCHEIEATCLVPADSPIRSLAEVDRPGVRIAVGDNTACGTSAASSTRWPA